MRISFRHYRVPMNRAKESGQPDVSDLFLYRRGEGRFVDNNYKWTKPAVRGGATRCTIYLDEYTVIRGVAFCSYSDNFCYKTGRRVAFARAFRDSFDEMLKEEHFHDIGVLMNALEGLEHPRKRTGYEFAYSSWHYLSAYINLKESYSTPSDLKNSATEFFNFLIQNNVSYHFIGQLQQEAANYFRPLTEQVQEKDG